MGHESQFDADHLDMFFTRAKASSNGEGGNVCSRSHT